MAKRKIKQVIVHVPGLGNCVVVTPKTATLAALKQTLEKIKNGRQGTWVTCEGDPSNFDVRASAIVGAWIYEEG